MMTNRGTVLTFCVLVTITFPAVAELPPHVQRVVDVGEYISRNPRDCDVDVVTPDIRADVVSSLRERALGYRRDFTSGAALVRLKDQPSIDEMLAVTHQTGFGYMHSFVEAGEPWIVPHLAPLFLRNDGNHSETTKVGDHFVEDPPKSVSVAYAVLRLLANSRDVSDEARQWADKRYQYFPYEPAKFRAMFAAWWSANEMHFVNGEYHKVQPGPFAPIPPSSEGYEPPKQESSIATAPLGPPITQPASTAARGTANGSTASYLAVATICVILLLSLLLFWKRGCGT